MCPFSMLLQKLFEKKLAEQFADFGDKIYVGDTGAFYLDNISAVDVNLFLLKQTYKSP